MRLEDTFWKRFDEVVYVYTSVYKFFCNMNRRLDRNSSYNMWRNVFRLSMVDNLKRAVNEAIRIFENIEELIIILSQEIRRSGR